MGSKPSWASTAGMAVAVQEGIGDTIRVSLTPDPAGTALRKVIVAQEILQTMGCARSRRWSGVSGLRPYHQQLLSGALPHASSRTSLAHAALAARVRRVEDMTVAVMGCVVTGRREQACQHRHQSARTASARWRRCTRTARRPSPSRASASPKSSRNSSKQYVARRYARSVTHERARRTQVQALRGGTTPLTHTQAQQLLGQLSSPGPDRKRARHPARVRIPDFYRTMSFVNALAHIANIEDHHPDLEVGYNYCPRHLHHPRHPRTVGKRLRVRREG